MSNIYHVAAPNGTQYGQMSEEELTEKIKAGHLPADTLIWKEGWTSWKPVSTVVTPPAPRGSWGIFSALKSVYYTRYFDFHGRASRSEYWYSVLGGFLFSILYSFLCVLAMVLMFQNSHDVNHATGVFICLFMPLLLFVLYSIIPGIALAVRRLHDIGLSGWFYLISLVPYGGGLFLFICALIPSAAPNKWGYRSDDPV